MLNAVFKEQKENVHTHSLAILLSFPSIYFGIFHPYYLVNNASSIVFFLMQVFNIYITIRL